MSVECRIAIIDTGFDYQSKLSNPIVESINYIDYTMETDNHGHGTCLFRMIDELSTNIIFYNLKVLDSNKRGQLKDLKQAMKQAILFKVHIINLSLGFYQEDDKEIQEIIDLCYQEKIIIINTVPNNGQINSLACQKNILMLKGLGGLSKNNLFFDEQKQFYTSNSPKIVPWLRNQYIFSGANSFLTPFLIKIIIDINVDFRDKLENIVDFICSRAHKLPHNIPLEENEIVTRKSINNGISCNKWKEIKAVTDIYDEEGKIDVKRLNPLTTTKLVDYITRNKIIVNETILLEDVLTIDRLLLFMKEVKR